MVDHDLAKTLSARYYVPGRILANLEAGVQQRSSLEAISQQAYARRSASAGITSNRVSKRGRPRMSPPRTEADSHDRRTQVRHAQRTYRLKKEAMFRDMKNRVVELQDTVDRISASLADFHDMAIESDLHVTHPYLFDRLNDTLAQVQKNISPDYIQGEDTNETSHQFYPTATRTPNLHTFGYMVSPDEQQSPSPTHPISYEQRSSRYSHPLYTYHLQHIEKPLSGTAHPHSYSFHETDFSRRLHRYCLEYTWRIFIDPNANPQEFYRVFRLVPCIRYMDKMRPYLQCLVRSGTQESLDLAAAPFYCIGGAGTHYPRLLDGQPVYPENMRLPRRILGILPHSGVRDEKVDKVDDDRDALLKALGLHGVWLDCRDVQGYLEEKGLALDGPSCVYASGPGVTGSQETGRVVDGSVMDVDVQSEKTVVPAKFHSGEDEKPGESRASNLTLNVEDFFRLLLKNMIILGRAPGFRLSDVETAFKSTVKMSSK